MSRADLTVSSDLVPAACSIMISTATVDVYRAARRSTRAATKAGAHAGAAVRAAAIQGEICFRRPIQSGIW